MPRNRGRGILSWGGFLTPLNLDVAHVRVEIFGSALLLGSHIIQADLEGEIAEPMLEGDRDEPILRGGVGS